MGVKIVKDELIYIDDKAYSVAQIPTIIQNNWESLKVVKEKSQKATKAAQEAKKSVDSMHEVKWYNKKQAIEDVHKAVKDTSTAMSSLADANQASFEYQQELAKMTKLLFNLGVGTRTATRCVIREVRALLENASSEELDTLAEEELNRVLMELNAQEDLSEKQQRAFDLLKEQDARISTQEGILSEQEYQIGEHDKKIKFVSDQINKVRDKNLENEKLFLEQKDQFKVYAKKIDDGEKKDKEQDRALFDQRQKDIEHDNKIKEGERKDKEQDTILDKQKQKGAEHDKRLDAGDAKDKKQDEQIKTNAERVADLEFCIQNLEEIIEIQNNRITELEYMLVRLQNNDKILKKKKWSNGKH